MVCMLCISGRIRSQHRQQASAFLGYSVPPRLHHMCFDMSSPMLPKRHSQGTESRRTGKERKIKEKKGKKEDKGSDF